MDFEITKERILEVAELHGLKVEFTDKPGLYNNGEKVEMKDLFADLFKKVEEKKV